MINSPEKKQYMAVFIYPMAIIWKIETNGLPKAKIL